MTSQCNKPLRRTRGLTLIEVLVVVAIIAILITLTLSAVNNTIKRGAAAECVSQLRQIGAAIAAYQAENQMEFPPAVGAYYPGKGGSSVWYSPTTESSPDDLGLAAYTGGEETLMALSVCPLNKDPEVVPPCVNTVGYPYIVNYWVMPSNPKPIRRSPSVTYPSKTLVMMDSATKGNWGYGVTDSRPGPWTTRVQESHFGKTNFLWADGHVSASKKDEIQYSNFDLTVQ